MVTKHEVQRGLIEDGFRAAGTPVGAGWSWTAGPVGTDGRPQPAEFLYRERHIVVREEFVDAVTELLTAEVRTRGKAKARVVARPVTHGVRLLRLPGSLPVVDALQLVAAKFGRGVATYDYVIALSQVITGWCAAREPWPRLRGTAPVPGPVDDADAGENVRVVILDNGIDQATVNANDWLAGVVGDPDEEVVTDDSGNVRIHYAGGHGTVTAGLVRMMAPRADVRVVRAFPVAGAAFETDLVQQMEGILQSSHPDVICLPAGTRAADATGLLAFATFLQNRLSLHAGVVVVAAAGNDGANESFWPATGPGTVTVGALTRDGSARAEFTNFGGWVDVYTVGDEVVNAFPTGRYTYSEPPREGQEADFEGVAEWSGTSFSAAIVAGMIAARMWRDGLSGTDAAAALVDEAQDAPVAGVGACLLPPS
ncbi:S8/S53 family peptidase [Virgisporangium aurantiacum]|uniref:Peptidase S8/S53 domain-containing protein n=1 Tax=Virgisporangium aurantiacum TaxID=175570 RepID=A0A8J3Z8Z6_9ACTN|nr:S8/S53 family peptidase [Virgisporangium aurantiacum]GIJ57465.1 hypothetical protein Vau01_049810 [Virgisporangium aurantiacum]